MRKFKKLQMLCNKVDSTYDEIKEKAKVFDEYQHVWMDDRKQIVETFKVVIH